MVIDRKPDNWNTFLKMLIFSVSALMFVASLLIHQPRPTKEEILPRPSITNLVGNWVPDEATKAFLREKGLTSVTDRTGPRIILRSFDYRLEGIPDFMLREGNRVELISLRGEWSLSQADGAWKINFYPQSEITGYVVGESPPYRISLPVHTYSFRRLIFVREE